MARSYPSPSEIDLPFPDESDPASEYAHGMAVQYNRMWALLIVSFILNIALAGWSMSQALRYKPTVSYVSLEGGYPVLIGNNEVTIGGTEYNPARLRGVVKDYLEARFSYDWQNLGRVNDAMKFLSDSASKAEQTRLTTAFLQARVFLPQTIVKLNLDYLTMQVSPAPSRPGVFRIKVSGTRSYNDIRVAPDPQHPQITPVTFELEVTRVKPTDANRDGYLITRIPEEII